MTLDDFTEDRSLLAPLDPTLLDPPPPSGSARHHQILERAMTEPTIAGSRTVSTGTTSVPESGRPSRSSAHRGRRLALAGVAAVVFAIVAVVVLAEPDRPVTPAAALANAADNTGDVTTLRVHADYVYADQTAVKLDGEADGRDFSNRIVAVDPNSGMSSSAKTKIGDTVWTTSDGRTAKETDVSPSSRNAPYQISSRSVVRAALTGSEITDLGRESVRGSDATHYRIGLTQESITAMEALSPTQTAQFELEYPQEVTTFDVWVDDGLIRRIDLRSPTQGRSTIEFYDFGADITITPPT